MSEQEREQAAELQKHRDDADEWSEEPIDVESRPSGSQVVSFRMPTDEFQALENAVAASGEKLSEYVRKALALKMHGTPIGPAVEITSGASRLVIRSHIITNRRTEAAPSIVSDFAPTKVAL